MAIGSGVTSSTVSALNGLPFENIIGGPLNACVLAQKEAALTTIDFIQSVGLTVDKDGRTEAIYVYFTFVQNGRKVNISVPLLTIVPIPYIAINTIDINFKASIKGTEATTDTISNEASYTGTQKTNKRLGLILNRKKSTMTSTISTKRDSKSTAESSYSIEATVDVAVHASQDSMPAGMAKILEMLGSAIDLCNPEGELTVSSETAKEEETVTITYKGSDGIYHPEAITLDINSIELKQTSDGIGKYFVYPKTENNNTVESVKIKVGGTLPESGTLEKTVTRVA